jgi:hypothetical protein
MKLVISLDVEEEGLFSGCYPRTPAGVTNVAELRRLEFIPREWGFPLTLLVTYQVARDPAARQVLREWRDRYGAELGAHLHPWNTPPFGDLPFPEPVRSERMPRALLRAKLATLVETLTEAFGRAPTSFRMGRFDGGPQVLSLLPDFGFRVDSSMVPLTSKVGGPDYFLAAADPFPLPATRPEALPLLEAPLTMVPLWSRAPALIYHLSRAVPGAGGQLLRTWFPYVAAAGIHPAWFPLFSMRWAVQLHRRRKGQVLTMFLHSSELLPGGNPQFPTEAAVNRLVTKTRAFLTWLTQTGPVKGVTLSQLGRDE